MTAIYTVLLGAVFNSAAGTYLLFNAPGGYVTVIRDVVITNHSSNAGLVAVQWYYQGTAYDVVRLSAAASSSSHHDMRQVVPVTGATYLYSTVGPISAVVTGYRFSSGAGAALLPVEPWPMWGNSPQE